MLALHIDDIKKKILAQSELSAEELDKRINDKLASLSGLLSPEGAAHIIANELNVKLFDPLHAKVKDVLAGLRNVDLVGRVVKKYEARTFTSGEREGQVATLLLGDETGTIRVVFWNKQVESFTGIKEQDIIKLVGAFAKENQGRTELHMNDKSRVILNPTNVSVAEVKAQTTQKAQQKVLAQVKEFDVVDILATIVQVFDLRFFEVCPDCGKRVKQETEFACPAHGKVTPTFSYVLNGFVDDGSSNMRIVLFKEQVQQFLEKTDADLQKVREQTELFDEIKKTVLGKIMVITGRVTKNKVFDRLELVVQSIKANPNPQEEIARAEKMEPLEADVASFRKEVEEALEENVE